MKFVVVGANGFIGSSLIKKLLSGNNEIVAIDVKFDNPILDSKLVKKIIIKNDILSLTDSIKDDYDAMYNFAWRGVNGPDKSNYDVQIDNIKNCLIYAELAKAIGCKKYICSGTIAERSVESLSFLDETSPNMLYGTSKFAARYLLETYCKSIGLNFVWLQFSNIYGPNNKTGNLISYLLSCFTENKIASFGPANNPYDFIFVDDLIEAIYRIGIYNLKKSFYFIGSGKPRLLKEYLLTVGEICNKKELVHIGERPDDGIIYKYDMFDIKDLIDDIGQYVSNTFEENIMITLKESEKIL